MEDDNRYRAFVSYRHKDLDRKWARWLLERIESYRTPRVLVRNGAPARIGRLFRDDDEIPASDDLSHQVEDALRASQFLIVVCSPDTPSSKWIAREIEFFRALGRGDHILAFLVAGEPEESFPQSLLHKPDERVSLGSDVPLEIVYTGPIAADVRRRDDESRHSTERRALLRIAAALLGLHYDDLARRERVRRIRRQSIWAAAAASALLLLSAAGYAYWDRYLRVEARYYTNFSTRWGVPFGIGQISREVASHRGINIIIYSQANRVMRVDLADNRGHLVPSTDDVIGQPDWGPGVARWNISYLGDRIGEIDLFGAAGQRKGSLVLKFDPKNAKRAFEIFQYDSGGAQSADQNLYSLIPAAVPFLFQSSIPKSQISQHELIFSGDGLTVRRLFQNAYREPMPDGNGSYGQAYAYDRSGIAVSVRNLDQSGKTLTEKNGVVEKRYFYRESPVGPLDYRTEWRDASGRPVAADGATAATGLTFDRYGNVVRVANFGADGRLTRNRYGFAVQTVEIDQSGNETRATYYGPRGERTTFVKGPVSAMTTSYDANGYAADYRFFGVHDNLIVAPAGYSEDKIRRDEAGEPVEIDYFGPDGKPCLMNGGYAKAITEYANGLPVSVRYFGTNGKPIIVKGGYASTKSEYDDQGNLTSYTMLDAKGRPTMSDFGYASIHSTYERGNLIRQEACDSDGNLVNSTYGFAIAEFIYNRGFRTEVHYLGPDGKPIVGKDGYASEKIGYDSRGNMNRLEYFDAAGAPTVSAEGASLEVAEYDAKGNLTRGSFFGPDGRPITAQNGIARFIYEYNGRGQLIRARYYDVGDKQPKVGFSIKTLTYDDRGNQTSEAYFAADGKPTANALGYAAARFEYDEAGRQTETQYLGLDGKPVIVPSMGFARAELRYDATGHIVDEAYFDQLGKPLAIKDGIARVLFNYDEFGNNTMRRYFGPSGAPVLASPGAALVTARYDDRGHEIEEAYFDADGKPHRGIFGYASFRKTYDSRGNESMVEYFGVEGEPVVATNLGYSKDIESYDSRDIEVGERYFGTDGKPILSNEGFSVFRGVYNAWRKPEDLEFFGVDGKPIAVHFTALMGQYAAARVVAGYNDRNVLENIELFGPRGNIVYSGPPIHAPQ